MFSKILRNVHFLKNASSILFGSLPYANILMPPNLDKTRLFIYLFYLLFRMEMLRIAFKLTNTKKSPFERAKF